MNDVIQLVRFNLDDRPFAVRLSDVARVLMAVAVTPLPGAPEIVLGAINLAGKVVPVISLHRRFLMSERDIDPSDRLIVIELQPRESNQESGIRAALVVNAVDGAVEVPREQIDAPGDIVAGLEGIDGVARLPDGLLLIHDLRRCLSPAEFGRLKGALQAGEQQ